jgi:hypothetical protein
VPVAQGHKVRTQCLWAFPLFPFSLLYLVHFCRLHCHCGYYCQHSVLSVCSSQHEVACASELLRGTASHGGEWFRRCQSLVRAPSLPKAVRNIDPGSSSGEERPASKLDPRAGRLAEPQVEDQAMQDRKAKA